MTSFSEPVGEDLTNDQNTRGVLEIGDSVSGYANGVDKDWYGLSLVPGTLYRFSVTYDYPSGSPAPWMQIFDKSSNHLTNHSGKWQDSSVEMYFGAEEQDYFFEIFSPQGDMNYTITLDPVQTSGTIYGTNVGDFIYGGPNNDTIVGGGGRDSIYGGGGDDTIVVEFDHARGHENDIIQGDGGHVSPNGIDTVVFSGNASDFTFNRDVIYSFTNSSGETINNYSVYVDVSPKNHPETLPVTVREDIEFYQFDDVRLSLAQVDAIIEQNRTAVPDDTNSNTDTAGDDNTASTDDTSNSTDTDTSSVFLNPIYGTEGDDTLIATTDPGANTIISYGGNDILIGGDSNDYLEDADGDSSLFGEGGNDRLYGGNGNNTLNGGEGDSDAAYYFRAQRSDFTFYMEDGYLIAETDYSRDKLIDVEYLYFHAHNSSHSVADLIEEITEETGGVEFPIGTTDTVPVSDDVEKQLQDVDLNGGELISIDQTRTEMNVPFSYNDVNILFLEDSGSVYVQDSEGIESWSGTNRINFNDGTLIVDRDDIGFDIYRLYKAAFNREPDNNGLSFWVSQADNDLSLESIASNFMVSDEFQTMIGDASSNGELVDLFYANVLGRSPDSAGRAFWIDGIERGVVTVEDLFLNFANSDENKAYSEQVIDDGIWIT